MRVLARYDGLGLALQQSTGIFGLDLDGCRNLQSGELLPEVEADILALGTYAEVSPSGNGVRIFGWGSCRGTGGQKRHPGRQATRRHASKRTPTAST